MSRKFSHLTLEERKIIEKLYKSGESITTIAEVMERSDATIYRELERVPDYTAKKAQEFYDAGRAKAKQSRIDSAKKHKQERLKKELFVLQKDEKILACDVIMEAEQIFSTRLSDIEKASLLFASLEEPFTKWKGLNRKKGRLKEKIEAEV